MAEDFNYKNRVRSYEVSIWTLQDRFLSVLKWSEMDCKGQIQEPEVVLRDDGTQEFTFSIPRYYQNGLNRIENPMWLHLENQPLEANMHKLKVIFNKNTEDEKVFEFLVTEVTHDHTQDSVMLTIKSEGLAFHELGKIGYKIALSETNYTNALDEWEREGFLNEEPLNNIQFWNDLVFKNKKGEWRTNWTYEVNMDWSAFSSLRETAERDPHTLYEDEYVSSWVLDDNTMTMKPKSVQETREKCRIIEVSESNIYNITQTIAEQFGVFCRYEYIHDANYQIIGRKVIYYNNYLQDTLGHIDLTYPYTSTAITRTVDSSNITTKMYVTGVDYDQDTVHIMDVEANKSKEDYLLNFDYLHDIQAVNDDQYDEIEKYEASIRLLNDQLIRVQERIRIINDQLVDADAKLTTYTNAVQGDTEQIADAGLKISAIVAGDAAIPLKGKVLSLMNSDTEGYYVNIKDDGILGDTIKLFLETDHRGTEEKNYKKQVTHFNAVRNEYGNIIRLNHIIYLEKKENSEEKDDISNYNIIHMFASWNPYLAQEKIRERWVARKAMDEAEKKKYEDLITDLTWYLHGSRVDYALVDNCKAGVSKFPLAVVWGRDEEFSVPRAYWSDVVDQCRIIGSEEEFLSHGADGYTFDYFSDLDDKSASADLLYYQDVYIDDKNEHISAFERLMGPALREGYWNPENYHDYGDLFKDNFSFSPIDKDIGATKTEFLTVMWDKDKYYDSEEPFIYSAGVASEMETHLAIRLSEDNLEQIKDRLEDVCFVYREPSHALAIKEAQESTNPDRPWIESLESTMYSYYRLGGGCELGWIGKVEEEEITEFIPALIVTGVKDLDAYTLHYIVTGQYVKTGIDTDYNRLDKTLEDLGDCSSFVGLITHDDEDKEIPYPAQWQKIIELGSAPRTPASIVIDYKTAPIIEGSSVQIFSRVIEKLNDNGNIRNYLPEEYKYRRLYPRLYFNTLKLKYEDLMLKRGSSIIEENTEYYTVQDDRSQGIITAGVGYYTTLRPEVLFKQGKETSYFSIAYTLSNLDTSIYLDALAVAYENSRPKVSYNVELSVLYPQFIHNLYDRLNQIVYINDIDLKLEDTSGYVSTITMKLDRPWEDTVEIKNYETKFEDLFSTIVAQTEAMKSSQAGLNQAISAFTSTGLISDKVIQQSVLKADLNLAFNQGTLTIDQNDGIWGKSDAGVVAFRGGGIFTATQHDGEGNWIWNTGILPSGINANLITSGQLDTNKIRIFSGDQLRFQWNGEGLYAYKSEVQTTDDAGGSSVIEGSVAPLQYVVYNSEGLFLRGEKGISYQYTDDDGNVTDGVTKADVDRVEVSWRGLILRNWHNKEVFVADPNTGDLTLKGTIEAGAGKIGGWEINEHSLTSVPMTDNGKTFAGIQLRSGPDKKSAGIELNTGERFANIRMDNDVAYYEYVVIDRYGNETNQHYYYPEDKRTTDENQTITLSAGTVVKKEEIVHISVTPKYYKIENNYSNGASNETAAYGNNYATFEDTAVQSANANSKVYVMLDANLTNYAININGEKIEYPNNSNTLDASWYRQLQAKYSNNNAYENYVNYQDNVSLVDYTLGAAVTLKPYGADNVTFRVYASDGETMILRGKIGDFKVSNNGLSQGTLQNSYLSPNNRFQVNNQTHLFGEVFYDITANSNNGTFTLKRINGANVNFNIAAMKAYQNAIAAAAAVTLTLNVNSSTGEIVATATSGGGVTITRRATVDTAIGTVLGGTSAGCGSCGNTCSGGCRKTCTGECKGTCKQTCASSGCEGGCSGTCFNGCGSGCAGKCSGTCSARCANGCTTTCTGKVGQVEQ